MIHWFWEVHKQHCYDMSQAVSLRLTSTEQLLREVTLNRRQVSINKKQQNKTEWWEKKTGVKKRTKNKKDIKR